MSANGHHLITTRPKRTQCERCKRVVLDGIADGMNYRADAIPLNATGEVHARLAGRSCYRLIASRLVHRDHHDIANDVRAGRPPVAAAHTCEPVDPGHIDPKYVAAFMKLTAAPTEPEPDQDQHSLFVLSGASAGARLTAITVDEPAPF